MKRNGSMYGANDRGDLGGVPGWTLQCKNTQQDRWLEWFTKTEQQAANNKTRWWAVIRKMRGKAVELSLFVMTLEQGRELMAHLRELEKQIKKLKAQVKELEHDHSGEAAPPRVRPSA
ncbi:hypothetical protein [Nonomuraea recticatena]|uniref:hypothetical protein n=1 Tax=Nonomuraea recticatena TaxID=46178 RepID=UPI0031F7702B